MTEQARAFWTVAPGRGEIRTETLAPRGSGEVLVRALFSGISRGTESLVFRGAIPESEHLRMRAPFQSGTFPGPVKYGYASVGEVEQGPAEWQGRRVFVLHPHQTRFIVPISALQPLPSDLPAERAVLAANMETAVNGLWDAAPRIGDRISIIGGGTVGCLVAWLAGQIGGCEVELVDTNAARGAMARHLGVPFALPEQARHEADVVIHASGSPAGLALALDVAGFEATVTEMSWYGAQAVSVPLGEAFHARRLRLVSSQVGHVASAQRARWDHARRMSLALSLLRHPLLDALITGESLFETLPEVMPGLVHSPGDTLCHRIRYA